MAVAVKSLGLPWVHSDVTCTNCHVSPILGYRYICETCPNHDLCEKCFRLGHTQMGHNFLRIARDSKNFHPPFQVYYIICDECGQAPIEGRRYHHRWRPNRNLCIDCFSKQPHAAREYEVIDDVKIPTICTTHQPVFHFHKCCGSCGVKPITGPRFDSITYPDYSLCLVCFDTKFIKGAIKNEDFIRLERPETNKVRQIFVYSCMSCGEVPICGPAYVNQRVPEKVYCLLCYMNVPRQVQFEYSRVDPPTQLGDPPAPSVSQSALLSHGSVRSEDYAKLAREFETYKKEREEKDDQAKVMAKKYVELNDKFVKQQTMGRSGDSELERLRREKDEAVLACAKLSDDIERLRKEKEDDAEYATRIYVGRIEALEKQLLENEEAAKTSASSLTTLQEEFEKLKIEKEEAAEEAAEFASLTKDLETSASEKETHAALALEFHQLKEEHLGLTGHFGSLKRKSEEDSKLNADKFDRLLKEHANLSTQSENEKQELLILISSLESSKAALEETARVSAERREQLVKHNLSLTEDYNTLMEEKETLEKERDEMAKTNTAFVEEVESLKIEFAEASETINHQAIELASLNAGKEETRKTEHLKLSVELEKLKQMHFTLTTEYENLMKEKEDAANVFAEKYDNLAKEHLSVNEEFDEWKESKALAEKEWSGKLIELTRELTILKEKERTGSVISEKYTTLETSHSQYKEERDVEIRKLEERFRSLQNEYSVYREETEEIARLAAEEKADFQKEVEKLKGDAAEWADLIEQFQRLVKDKEAKLLEMDQTLKNNEADLLELEHLLKKKEAEAEARADECSALTDDVKALEKENEDLIERHRRLREEFEKYQTDQEEELKKKETVMSRGLDDKTILARELDGVRKELAKAEETTRISRLEFTELSEEYENLQDEVKTLQDEITGHRNLTQDLKKQKSGKEEEVADLVDRIQSLENLLKEKDEAPKTGAASQSALFLKEIDSLKEEVKNLKEEKEMAEDNAAGLIHELQKQVEKLEKQMKGKENASATIGKSSPVSPQKRTDKPVASKEEYNKVLAVNETLKEELESVREDFDEIFPKYKELFQSKISKNEYDQLQAEFDRLKSSLPGFLTLNIPIQKCALAAICCHGVLNERKRESLEQGYERSRRNTNDGDLLRQSEEFMSEAVKELDDKFLNYMEDALQISDKEAQDYFMTMEPMFNQGKHSTPISKVVSMSIRKGGSSPRK